MDTTVVVKLISKHIIHFAAAFRNTAYYGHFPSLVLTIIIIVVICSAISPEIT